MRFIAGLFLFMLTIESNAQKNSVFNVNLGLGNTWYNFDPAQLKGIFLHRFEPGIHNNNLAYVAVEAEYNQRIVNHVWFSTAGGPMMSRFDYSNRKMGKKDTVFFKTTELFLQLRSGLRFYSNEYVSPLIFLEIQPGIAWSFAGRSEKTDYAEGDFYKPGQLLFFIQAGIGIRKIVVFYRQYQDRGMAADQLKTVGLTFSFGT